MSTKTLLPNQHTPLHWLYGHDNCCLCRIETEQDKLRQINLGLVVEIENMQKHIEELEGEIDDWERYGYKK